MYMSSWFSDICIDEKDATIHLFLFPAFRITQPPLSGVDSPCRTMGNRYI